MALQLPFMTFIGLKAEAGYFVIENLRHPKRGVLVFDVKGYVTGERNDAGFRIWPHFWSKTFTIDIDATQDPWPQAYAYLKALPEFEGAIDV